MSHKSLGYEEKKAKLISDVKECAADKANKICLRKDSSNLFRERNREKDEKRVDVRSFNKVISVDKVALIAEVEGMTSYEELVKETLKHSCLPTVVPELKSITIGGALAGCGIESSSFRHGLVHETVKELEVLLGDGSVVTCTPYNEHKDLFFALPNTFGTLGYALKIKVQLVPTKKYVKLTHIPFSDAFAFFEELGRLCRTNRVDGEISFIDGVVFDKNEMYVTIGEFVEEAPFVSNYKYMAIYYQSIQKKRTDYLKTLDYIWRWDPDWFWCSKVFFMQNPIVRLLLGKFMLKSTVYTKIMHFVNRHPSIGALQYKIQGRRESVIQDVLIPIENAPQFLEFIHKEIGIKPIWVCPTRSPSAKKYDFCPVNPEHLYIDFGFWDSIPSDKEEGYYNKKIEEMTVNLKGFKSLYSRSYYTEEQFWKILDRIKYFQIKNKYDQEGHLKDLYTKCVKK